jgi:DNA-binding XRE family transcriptional regulator
MAKNNITPISDQSADTVVTAALCNKLLLYRAKHHLTQRQFAKLADVSRTTVQSCERCANITKISQIKIMRIISDNLL